MPKIGRASLQIITAATLLILGTSTASWAGVSQPVPEIDPSTGMAAIALITGAVLIIRSRRKKSSSTAKGDGI